MNTEMGMADIKMDTNMPPPMEVQTSEQNVEVEIEMEMKNDITDDVVCDPVLNQNQVRKVEPVSPKQKSKNQNQNLDRNLTNLSQQRKRGNLIVNLLV